MEHLSRHATVSGKDSVHGAASIAHLNGGSKSGILCGDRGQKIIHYAQHQGVFFWDERCDRVGKMDLPCSAHQSPAINIARTETCQFTGCFHAPKYGHRKGPLRFCKQHKRAGMYTIHNGQPFVAMRDGSAFRDDDATKVVGADTSTRNFAIRKQTQYNGANCDTTAISPMGSGCTGGEPNAPSERKYIHTFDDAGLQVSAKPVSFSPGRALDKITSPRVMAATSQYRKKCEAMGCRIQPSYGPRGTTRPQFCSSHKKEGMVGLKNRPCIFPGCTTRPHYGLLGCRPIYCTKHKEADMVHLLKEATIRGKLDVKSGLGKTIRHGADAAPSLSLPLMRKHQKHERKAAEKVGTHRRRNTASSIQTVSSSSTSSSIPASTNKLSAQVRGSFELGDLGKCEASGLSPSLTEKKPSSILADSLGVTPSLEIQVPNDIKGSEQTRTRTRISKTRVRVPSRKALEAWGKLRPEDVQLLTKEKKKEEARRMKNFKAQRKAAAAMGLKDGYVIETAIIDPAISGEYADIDGSGAGDMAKAEPAKIRWRKLSPEEIMELSARKSIPYVIKNIHSGGEGRVASRAGAPNDREWRDSANDVITRTSVGKRKEIVWYPQSNTRVISSSFGAACPQDAKRRKESYKDLSAQMRQVMPSADGKEPREVLIWKSTGNDTGSTGVGDIGGMNVCQFDVCEKEATFGVNGIVRYCKLHAIFGMRRINIPV